MARLTKKAEILEKLHSLVEKEAALAQTDVSGKPGVDTDFQSVSDSTETTDKNSVGPDKLNDKQKYEQKPATDESVPVASPKQAEATMDIDKLASDILAQIQEKLTNKSAALAQTNISGKPGVDTDIQSVSDATEHTDKNSVGPEKLNDKQKFEQKPSTDESAPLKSPKKAEEEDEATKTASYKLGASFCEALIKRANDIKAAEQKTQQAEFMKQAGRRDFEVLIAQAAEEIKIATAQNEANEKQAEEAGARAFDELYKQAQYDAAVEENNYLKAKIAEYAAIEKEAESRLQAIRDEENNVKLAQFITDAIKRELSTTAK